MDAGNEKLQGATLTVDEAHEMIGCGNISRGAFYAAINRGEVPHIRLGKRILIPRHAFSRFLEGVPWPENERRVQ